MYAIIFYLIPFIFLIAILITIIYLSYWIPKRLGNRKLGVILSRGLIILTICYCIFSFFEDKLFFNFNARNLLSEHDIFLVDDFKIIKNESGGIRDYMHVFELEISDADKLKLIDAVKTSNDYKDTVYMDFDITKLLERYSNDEITRNYQNQNYFVRESYKTNGKGYCPIIENIKIAKIGNNLIFERIED